MKRITIAAAVIVTALLLASCATARAEQPKTGKCIDFGVICDLAEPDDPNETIRILGEIVFGELSETTQDDEYEEWYEEYYEPYYESSYSGDGFMQEGVRAGVDSNTETWYSSARAYHKDTAQWSTDDEGYYRTDEGYYVVASNDYEYGTVIETSKGKAQVLDDGTYSGNCDFYVDWEC